MFAISTATFVSVLALVSSLAAVVHAAGPRPVCTDKYNVVESQNCDAFAANVGLDKAAILNLNPKINCDGTIPAGTEVCIKESKPTCTVHAPATATTCDVLASLWDMTPANFVALNDDVNHDCTDLVVGQEYCVSVAIGERKGKRSTLRGSKLRHTMDPHLYGGRH